MSDYYDALYEQEWQDKRDEVLKRDHHRCAICERTRTQRIVCPSEPNRPQQTIHVGLNYANSIAVNNDVVGFCDREALRSGIITLFGGNAQTVLLDNARYVLLGRTYLISTTMESKDELSDKGVLFGLATCADGSLAPVMFKDDDLPFAPFDKNQIVRAYKSDTPVELHVHHKYYIVGNKPWEYPNDALVTLCSDCHEKIHKARIVHIPIYAIDSNGRKIKMDFTPCQRCNGQGYLKEYMYYRGGICFRCNGMKFEELVEKEKSAQY